MKELTINPKFEKLLAPLTKDEAEQLEQSILAHGCESPIVVWRDQIIDGHNRYNICCRHDVDFETTDRTFDFADEDAVCEWIYVNQLGRRNLNPNQRLFYIGELYSIRKKRLGGSDRFNGEPVEEANEPENAQTSINSPVPQFEALEGAGDKSVDPEPTIVYDEYSQVAPDDEVFASSPTVNGEGSPDAAGLDYEIDEQFKKREHKKRSGRTTVDRTSHQIGKEFGVSHSTVERAEKLVEAVKTLPEDLQKTFISGKMTQAAALEKAHEIAHPNESRDVQDPTRDAFTAIAETLSKELHTHFRAIKFAIDTAKLDFADKGQDFKQWAPTLGGFNVDIPLIDVKSLKSLRICSYCSGEKCPSCHETGYLHGSIYNSIPANRA